MFFPDDGVRVAALGRQPLEDRDDFSLVTKRSSLSRRFNFEWLIFIGKRASTTN